MKNSMLTVLLGLAALVLLTRDARAATDWEYPSPAGPTPVVINDNWDGGDITVSADANDAIYEVGNVGQGVAGDLEITSEGAGDASLHFGSRVDSVDDTVSDPPKPPNRINFGGDATLKGKADDTNPANIGRAILKVTDGNILGIAGTTTLDDYSALTLEGTATDTSYFLSGALIIKGREASLIVGQGGHARIFGRASVEEGTITVENGRMDFLEGLVVTGENSLLHLKGGARLDLSEDPRVAVKQGNGVRLDDGGTLRVSGANNVIGDGDGGTSFLHNQGGTLVVDAGGELVVQSLYLESGHTTGTTNYGTEIHGTLAGRLVHLRGAGTTLVTGSLTATEALTVQNDSYLRVEGLVLSGGYFSQAGGTTDILAGGMLSGDDLRVSGGVMNVQGEVTGLPLSTAPGLLDVSGGAVNVDAGGSLRLDTVAATGADAVITVRNGGIIAAGSELSASAGLIRLLEGSVIGEAAGLDRLHISGTGTVSVNSSFTTRELALSGGDLTLGGGTVTVANNPDPDYAHVVTGHINQAGGDLALNNDLTLAGGGIRGRSDLGGIAMNGYSVTTGGASLVDASTYDVRISGVTDFTLGASYLAGVNSGQVSMLEVTGMKANNGTFSVTAGPNQIQLTRDLQLLINSQVIGDGVLILDTDAENYVGDTDFRWDDDFFGTYLYEVRQDPTSGEYGLYVTESVARTREEQRQSVLAAWREHPEVLDDGLPHVLNNSMLDAIIDGTAIRIGRTEGYDRLSTDGKFNAGVLSTLRSPVSGSYDALMLYNGSGLAMANAAVLNNSQQTLKRLGSRNSFIRREMDTSCMVLNPSCDFEVEYPEFEPGNRLWATGNYTSDTSGHHLGFSGYKYRGRGVLVGYDRLIGRLAIGGAFSYMAGDFTDSSAQSSNSTIDTYGGYLYGSYNATNGFFVSAAAGYAYSDNQIRDYRLLDGQTGYNVADYGTTSYLGAVSIGKDWQVTETISLIPSAGLSYVRAHASDHSQFFTPDTGRGGANTLNAGKVKGYSAQVPLDLAVRYDWFMEDEEAHFTITGNVGYSYELNNKGASGLVTYGGLSGVGPVRIASRELGRHILNLGVNAKYAVRQYEFGFGYDYTGKKQYNSHTFLLNAGVVF